VAGLTVALIICKTSRDHKPRTRIALAWRSNELIQKETKDSAAFGMQTSQIYPYYVFLLLLLLLNMYHKIKLTSNTPH